MEKTILVNELITMQDIVKSTIPASIEDNKKILNSNITIQELTEIKQNCIQYKLDLVEKIIEYVYFIKIH